MLLLTGSVAGYWFWTEIIRELPNPNFIYNPPVLSSKILDKDGRLLYKFYQNENRTWVKLDKIPKEVVEATLAIEDKYFYRHHGISIRGMIQATLYNAKKEDQDKPRGGSTITQQLVKNVFLTGEKTWKRKIKEAILAVLVETKLSKEEILERYFNQVAYGGEIYGIQEAAWRYFGKNVGELNLAEAAFLAGLPAAPSTYSPLGVNQNLAFARQRHVLDEMVSAKYLTKEEAETAKNQKIEILKENRKIIAPHFVFYIKEIIQNKFGYDNFERQGLTIKTSLDRNIQDLAEKITQEEVNKVARLRISNGASLVLDVRNGDVLAMVGSKDYFATDIDGKVNVTKSLRQPGSSIKPINYLLALQKGMSLGGMIEDSPVVFPSAVKGQKAYAPQNYTGKYMGWVTLKTALASSLNTPSVKLLNMNGIDNMISLAEKMGITTWKDRSRFGLALALGSGEVKMTELAQAYSIFANMGEKIEVNPVVEIDNYLSEVVYKKTVEPEKVVEAKYAFLINEALSDDSARAPIFGTGSKLKIRGKTVAVKTGTTNSLKDNWCIGWTPSYLVAAWVGNNDSSPMSWVASGISGATPIWNRIMTEVIKDKPEEKWTKPDDVYKATGCGREDYFADGGEKRIKCMPTATPTPPEGTTVEVKVN